MGKGKKWADSIQVTLGLCLIGAVPFLRGGLVFVAQMLGAMASAGVVKALFPGPLAVTTSLSGGTNKAQGVFIEMVSCDQPFLEGKHLTSNPVPDGAVGFHHFHACCKRLARENCRASLLTPLRIG